LQGGKAAAAAAQEKPVLQHLFDHGNFALNRLGKSLASCLSPPFKKAMKPNSKRVVSVAKNAALRRWI
jgi:hypothetical protein